MGGRAEIENLRRDDGSLVTDLDPRIAKRVSFIFSRESILLVPETTSVDGAWRSFPRFPHSSHHHQWRSRMHHGRRQVLLNTPQSECDLPSIKYPLHSGLLPYLSEYLNVSE